jgi:hypothetical protein
MTDKRISDLTALGEATATDLLAIVDGTETKKITALDFVNSPLPLTAVLFDTSVGTPGSHVESLTYWDTEDKAIATMTEIDGVIIQNSQELQLRYKNNTGVTILNGKPVYMSGVDAGVPTIALAKADAAATAAVLGLVTADIDDGDIGRVTFFGRVRGLDTSGFNVNDPVYLSASVAGGLTNIAPDAPDTVSLIGRVETVDASNGTIILNSVVNSAVLDERYATKIVQSWNFSSPSGTSGTFYTGGFYKWAATDSDFSPAENLGIANNSYAAHVSFILGAATVDELTIRVTGTSITDAAVRTLADTEDIVIPNGTAVDSYFETDKKWLGLVVISVVSGTPKTMNYGFSKYWDDNNTDFKVLGIEATWLCGANDATPNISVIHHKTTGWTFNAGADPTPPYIARMNTDHVTEIQCVNNENGAWKRDNLSVDILGGDSEGVIVEIFTTANRAFGDNSNVNITFSPI